MPEQMQKTSLGASPVARAGGGDISERELSRERYTLQTTPPARLQPVHPKKQLFYTPAPVNKFTAKCAGPSRNLARIRSCLDEYRKPISSARPMKEAPKAMSMEDLTPTKRIKKDADGGSKEGGQTLVKYTGSLARCSKEYQAAARVCRVMVLAAWRRRRDEVRCLKKTLSFQVSCSERLRVQVWTLKSLLDSDNAKVRLAMRELDRLKQLVKERDAEKLILDKEKKALENDVAAAEDRASEMSIGWRNCRNELESLRASAAMCEHALSLERAAVMEARMQRDDAYTRLAEMEEELSSHETLLAAAEKEVSRLQRDVEERKKKLEKAKKMIRVEIEAREASVLECKTLTLQLEDSTAEAARLKQLVESLSTELAHTRIELGLTRRQLDWWPRPLTRMMGLARSWLGHSSALPQAAMWAMLPARHGC